MQRTIIIVLFLLLAGACSAQSNWARRVGAWSNDAYNDIAVDAVGNSYVTGEFGGVIQLGSDILMSQGSLDIIVAKYGVAGELLWVRTFGGTGLDRGVALALGPAGTLVITGQFMGAMQMGNDLLVSQGGTQDMFVASLLTSNGDVQWARQGGGADGVDQPNGISVAPDGSIAVTGEFRGTAVFDAGTITSVVDPLSGLPSVDIFVAAYDADGSALWLKQGSAKYADRGMSVAHDPLGNVYVTGQFSDTITFDQTHHNAMFSAIFLVKFNTAGEEEWFRRFGGGTYNQVFDLLVVDGTHLLLTGDLQGTVIFLDSAPDLFVAAEPRSSFLVEVGLDGEFIRQTTWGSEHVVNTRSVAVSGDEIAVFGRFQCQFTGFSGLYGDGTWLATGAHDLYVARFERADLSLKEAQQFGGQRNKVPGGIAYSPTGAPIFCGSFDHVLVFPANPFQFNTQPAASGVAVAPVPSGFCDDANYGSYVGLRGHALMDAFIARGWAEGRQPYDVFTRSPGDCDRPQRDMYIRMDGQGAVGPDTLRACLHADLVAYTHTAFNPDTAIRHTAPAFTFLWNTGNDSASIHVHDYGWYHVTVSSPGGCWVRTDSVYVIIDPLPGTPVVSDDVVVNTEDLTPANITVCEPQQPWLWTSYIDAQDSVAWVGPPGVVVGDSIQATATGLYTVTVTTPWGCADTNDVHVTIIPSGPLPPLDAVYAVTFPQDTDLNDTLSICQGNPLHYGANVELLLDGQSVAQPYGVRILQNCNYSGWGLNPPPEGSTVASCLHYGYTPGWNHYSIGIMLTNAPCGEDTLIFWATDSIYVIPLQVAAPWVSVTGPEHLCPGDTATVFMECTDCDQVNWSGPGIVQNFTDSLWVIAQGTFTAHVTNVDTNGCFATASNNHSIAWNPRPLLGVLPTDGIICPDSSATIFSDTQGTDYQWYGPLGPLNVDNDTIITSQQGLYYLEMVDLLGCPVTSDPVLVTDYATPYLNVLPDNMLCEPGETATLQVVTTGQPSLQWQWPLSGNALEQVVDQPGVYTCLVSACNIITTLSVEIFGNNAVAELVAPGPFTLCPDDELILQAAPGMPLTYWLPGPVVGPQLQVTTSGTYTLVAVDMGGCEASVSTEVTFLDWTTPLVIGDTIICAGTPLVLDVPGSGEVSWYADDQLLELLQTGNIIDLGYPQESITLYVQQVEDACASDLQTLVVDVLPIPEIPLVLGPDTACSGSPVVLTTTVGSGVLFTWTTPTGSVAGDSLLLEEATDADMGEYSIEASNGACSTSGPGHLLTVLVPELLDIGPDTLICPGGLAGFTIPEGFTEAVWNGSIPGDGFVTGSPGTVSVTALDAQGCPVEASVSVAVFAFTVPMSALPVDICHGADALLEAEGSGTFSWYGDAALSDLLSTGPSLLLVQPADSSVFYVQQQEWQCLSAPQAVSLNVTPVPMDVLVDGPAEVCLGSPIVLTLVGAPGLGGTWTMPSGTASGPQVVIAEASLDDAGLYTVVPAFGACLGDTLMTNVDVLVPMVPDLGPDTTFCDGGDHTLAVPAGFTDPLWTTGSTSYTIVVTTPGTYGVTVTDPQGCTATGWITLEQVHCGLEMPNVISPNGDGVNDELFLLAGPYQNTSMTIFNRLGGIVWEGDPTRIGFRGQHYMSAEPLSEGAYYYLLVLHRSDGRQREQSGYLHIVR